MAYKEWSTLSTRAYYGHLLDCFFFYVKIIKVAAKETKKV